MQGRSHRQEGAEGQKPVLWLLITREARLQGVPAVAICLCWNLLSPFLCQGRGSEAFKECVSRSLEKCKVKSRKGRARLGKPGKSHAFIWVKEQREDAE